MKVISSVLLWSFICLFALAGCTFLPGFGIAEDPSLYYLPVSEVSAQVQCELQDFLDEYRYYKMSSPTKTKWGLTSGDVAVTLTLQTDHSGYVNFTGINVAKVGLTAFESFITSTGSGAAAVPTLAAKVTPTRSRTVTIVFSVPVISSTSSKIEEHCPAWARNYANHLFLKEWLNHYFDRINATQADEAEIEKEKSGSQCNLGTNSGFESYLPPIASDPCIGDGVKIASVDLKTQFKIAADVSGGSTPALFGGAVFLLPVSGVGLDYNLDYSDSVDIKLAMCNNMDGSCSQQPPGALEPFSSWYQQQCEAYWVINPILGTMKLPQNVCSRANETLSCSIDKSSPRPIGRYAVKLDKNQQPVSCRYSPAGTKVEPPPGPRARVGIESSGYAKFLRYSAAMPAAAED